MSGFVAVNFEMPQNMTDQVMEGFDWLREVNDSAVGFTVGVHEEEGGHVYAGGKLTVAGIAHKNEFGEGVPQRAFMSEPFDQNVGRYSRMVSGLVGVDSVQKLNQGLAKVSEVYRGDVQIAITNRVYLKNAESTIAAKGSDTPLVDTGRMRQSILTRPLT